jgi:hypothetical protein
LEDPLQNYLGLQPKTHIIFEKFDLFGFLWISWSNLFDYCLIQIALLLFAWIVLENIFNLSRYHQQIAYFDTNPHTQMTKHSI